MSEVKEDSKVKVHYTGKLSSGEVFDSSENKDPLEFTMGQQQIIPGFEKGIVGMKEGDKKTIDIPSDDAYGPKNDQLVQKVEKSQLPDEINPEVGMQLASQTPDGKQIPLVVTEVEDATITVDANHPLAGKDLTFDVEIVAID